MQRDGGPAGGGNPTGGSFTGPAETLEIINDFCYAYSGEVDVDNVEGSLLEFTTGNFTAFMDIQFNYSGVSSTDDYIYRTYLNDRIVQAFLMTNSDQYGYQNTFVRIIVPPYTKMKCTADNQSSGTARPQICSVTGRIYRG